VPLPDGAVVNASRVGTGTGKVWNVTLDVSGQESPDGLAALYTDAGFQATSDLPGLGSTGGNAGYSNGNYGVLVVVTDDGADTYTANFSVTAMPT
ncbi:MAG: hypothetical protein JWQ43_402, partial [Glaciihabitans sp.]|nr:hypothetical protein [Glaciihabitans sp.]